MCASIMHTSGSWSGRARRSVRSATRAFETGCHELPRSASKSVTTSRMFLVGLHEQDSTTPEAALHIGDERGPLAGTVRVRMVG